jgi:type II secretory pathway pseudopilin PulG
LIELLVVIAIIGILSSVVLASLNSARSKGADAAVQSGLSNFQAQAALYYNNGQTYGSSTACTAGGVFSDTQAAAIVANVTSNASGKTVSCFASSTAYEFMASMSTGNAWCVDAAGYSGTTTFVTSPTTGMCTTND